MPRVSPPAMRILSWAGTHACAGVRLLAQSDVPPLMPFPPTAAHVRDAGRAASQAGAAAFLASKGEG